jgi:homeobox protein YOX1/YHP1
MSHASLERDLPSSRAAAQLPYARAPPATSPVPYDIPAETPPTIKKRKRADARQLEALNWMFCHTMYPSTEQRLQLANGVNMSPRSVRIWLGLTFVYMYNS